MASRKDAWFANRIGAHWAFCARDAWRHFLLVSFDEPREVGIMESAVTSAFIDDAQWYADLVIRNEELHNGVLGIAEVDGHEERPVL